ncbi:MAG: GTP cyclohydrolase MptA [Solirubrobacterales bacterium]
MKSESTTVLSPALSDTQADRPRTEVSLTRVGVTGVEKVLHVAGPDTRPQLFYAELECFVDLEPKQKGVHMSRFEEVVNEAIDEVVLGEALKAELLAAHIAERVRERQTGMRAEVTIAARYPETVKTPASGRETQEIYTLFGTAVASERGTRTLTGVQAHGMTACPCAQGLVADRARARLSERGYEAEEIDAIFEDVPVATHNQRGIGTLHIGRPEGSPVELDARDLLRIVERSMSSEIYELMKRSDEVSVVERAHRRPRFVEDCVREMVAAVCERYPELADNAFLHARQENLETIHRHNVVAERSGTLAEIRAELASGDHGPRHTPRREWLEL